MPDPYEIRLPSGTTLTVERAVGRVVLTADQGAVLLGALMAEDVYALAEELRAAERGRALEPAAVPPMLRVRITIEEQGAVPLVVEADHALVVTSLGTDPRSLLSYKARAFAAAEGTAARMRQLKALVWNAMWLGHREGVLSAVFRDLQNRQQAGVGTGGFPDAHGPSSIN